MGGLAGIVGAFPVDGVPDTIGAFPVDGVPDTIGTFPEDGVPDTIGAPFSSVSGTTKSTRTSLCSSSSSLLISVIAPASVAFIGCPQIPQKFIWSGNSDPQDSQCCINSLQQIQLYSDPISH